MTSQAGEFKEAMRDQWTNAAGTWRAWHPKMSQMSRDATEAVVDAARLSPGLAVLDLAGGTGEPGLTAARAVAPGGTVMCTDFTPGMVAAAEAHAKEAGITNMEFRQVDAEDIPFEDGRFDRVISRFGVMFFPDIQKALGEIRRVLKDGGRVGFATWQAVERNPWFLDIQKLFMERGLVQPPPPGMPTPFRWGQEGTLPQEMASAGFKDIDEQPLEISWSWPGPPEEYMDFMQGTFPAWRRGLAETDESTRNEVLGRISEIVNGWYDGKGVTMQGKIFVVSAAV